MEYRKQTTVDTDRRTDLINATIHTIAEKGLSGVTLAKVAAHSNMSAGIINFYFKSKRQLLLETLKFLIDEYSSVLNEWIASAESPEQRIYGYINSSFDKRVFVKEKIATWYAFWSEAHANDEYRICCEQSEQLDSKLLNQSFAELLAGTSWSAKDCEILAQGLEGIVNDIWQQSLFSLNAIDSCAAIKKCEKYVSAFVLRYGQPTASDSDSENSDLLPFWTYQDDEFFELEIDRLFKPNWMLVGHSSEIPNPGDYLTFHGFGERAFVVRNKNGQINAFHNICRHRGSTILVGQGRCRQSLSCPFHGWRYDFDGKLQFVPGKLGFPHVDPENYSLKPVDLEIWKEFIFIRFVSGGESLKKQLDPIEHEINQYRLEEVQPYREPARYASENPNSLPVNWKIFHDIDNEGYHVPVGHPSLQQLYGNSYTDTYINEIPLSHGYFNERVGKLWSVRNYRKLMPKFEHLSEDRQNLWLYVGVFPNLVFALYPDMMETYMSVPVSLTQTDVISKTYALPDNRKGIEALRYLNRRINITTGEEDYFYMESMQEGLKSSAYPNWTLHETAETGIRAYHHAIQTELPVARLRNKPERGTIARINDLMANGHAQARH